MEFGNIGYIYDGTMANKIRHLRQFLRGWAKNLCGQYKILKEKLILLIDTLDIKAETSLLSAAERAAKKEAEEGLAKWAQRAKVKYIQEGAVI